MTRVYLSSTLEDLRACRAAVRQALHRQSIDVVSMEDDVPEDRAPLAKCLADVAGCDVYIGLFAWRYGFVPPGAEESITELEYREARRRGIRCLIFLLREDAPWPRSKMELGAAAGRIERLRRQLAEAHLCGYFIGPDDLGGLVAAALAVANRPDPDPGGSTEERLNRYRDHLIKAYGSLELDSLTPPEAEEYPLSLMSVFVEPKLRGGLDPQRIREPVDPGKLADLRLAYRARPLRSLSEVVATPENRAVVLLGDPGSGKSVVSRYLALVLAGAHGRRPPPLLADHLPILVELRTYAALMAEGRCADFLDYLDHRSRADGLGLERASFESHLDLGGRVLVVFDGLDEVFEPRRQAEIAGQVVAFSTRYPHARVIVTSRAIGYSRETFAAAGFAHFTLQPLDEEQIEEFLGRWYPPAPPERATGADPVRVRLAEGMKRSAALRGLAGNPLLLTILAIVGHQVLPRDPRMLFEHATGVLVQRWDLDRHLGRPDRPATIDVEDKKALLRELAYHMQSVGPAPSANCIDRHDLRRIFEHYLVDRFGASLEAARLLAREMINEFRERNVILSRHSLDLYGFVHRAFLEYFCAEAVVRRSVDDVLRHFRDHWDDPAWREVLRLVAGAMTERDAAALIRLLTREVNTPWPPGEFTTKPWNLALAVQCLADVRALGPELAAPAEALLNQLILLLEHSVGRNDTELAALIDEEIVPVARSIGARWPGRRAYLTWYRRRGAQLVWSPTATFAAQLAAILSIPDDHLEELFDGELATIGDNRASYAAVAGLAELAGGPAAAPAQAMLVRRAVEDQHAAVRVAAVQALGERFDADDKLVAVLIERARSDGSRAVRQAAVRALGDRQRFTSPIRALLVDRAAADRFAEVRQEALQALVRRTPRDPELRRTLEGLLSDGRDAEVMTLAARALLDHFAAGETVRTLLLRRAGGEPGPVRRATIRLLGERWPADSAVVDLLVEAIATESDVRTIRDAALCFGSPLLVKQRRRPREALAGRIAREPDERVRLAALRTLTEHFPHDDRTREVTLDSAATDRDGTVRLAAVAAIARWAAEDESIRTALERRAREDSDQAVRGAALSALITAGRTGADGRGLLIDLATEDPEPRLRELAVRMLADRYGGHPATQRLIADRCRYDPSPDVRLLAVRLLSRLDHAPAAVDRVLIDRVRDDPSGRVVALAAASVGDWLGSGDARAVLIRRAGNDANALVRLAAAELLGRSFGADPEVRRVLAGLIRDDLDAAVLRAAAEALAATGLDAEQMTLLTARAAGDDPAVREAALQVLGERCTEAPETLATLLTAARHDDSALVRRLALNLLCDRFADRADARKALVAGLDHPDWSIRETAIRLLGRHYGADDGTWRLLAALAADRSDPQLSLLAGQTLSRLPGATPERMPTLTPDA